jgi:hypothetical protein
MRYFGALSHGTACTLALSPIRDTLSEGFSHFVTSIAAPAASGWSVAGWDLHPLESAALSRRTPISDMKTSRLDAHAKRQRQRPVSLVAKSMLFKATCTFTVVTAR